MIHHLTTPLSAQKTSVLCAGDIVYITGTIYTARDAAHKRLAQLAGRLPLAGEVVYYAGPCPAKEGEVIGSVGPTTSYRMDAYAQRMAEGGMVYSIGKGERGEAAREAIKGAGGVHFDAIGGAGAYYKSCVQAAEVVMFEDLGAEAVFKLTVKDFPVIVAII